MTECLNLAKLLCIINMTTTKNNEDEIFDDDKMKDEEIDFDGIDDDLIDFIIDDDNLVLDDEDIDENSTDEDSTEKSEEEDTTGKFRLKHDSIFKGRKTTEEDEEEISSLYIDTFTGLGPDPEIYDSEEEHVRKTELSRLVYEIITLKTDAKLSGCRRKPARVDFNLYYNCIITNIDCRLYTKTELFCELAQYFSDNYYSMLKLLQKEWSDEIINELQEKYKKFDLRKIDFF